MQIKTQTKVGAFTLLALAILAYMALYLNTLEQYLCKYTSYTVMFKNACGLVKKSEIKIAGIKVGWVEQVRLNPENSLAEVVLMLDSSCRLRLNAVISIAQEGLLGNKFVDVWPGSHDQDYLIPNNNLVLVGQTQVTIDDLIYKIDQVAQKIDHFIDKTSLASDDLYASIKQVSNLLDRNLDQLTGSLQETLGSAQAITHKINHGHGSLGKFLNEPELYNDLKITTNNFKQVASFYDQITFGIDAHFEAMFRNTCDNYKHKQAKGYANFWAAFRHNYFGLFGLVWSEYGGVVDRDEVYTKYFNQNGQLLTPTDISQLSCAYALVPALTKQTTLKRDLFTFNFQAGKWFNNLGIRAGLFENSLGFGLDYNWPFAEESDWRWLTTVEFFDFKGQNRLNDRRPYFKWLNSVYFRKNLYLAFGLDDFISKDNLNPFIGLGLTFGND